MSRKMNGTTDKPVFTDEPPKKRLRSSVTDGRDENTEILDPFCDPNNPVKVTFQDVSAAAYKIKGGIQKTPCLVGIITILAFTGTYLYVISSVLRIVNT